MNPASGAAMRTRFTIEARNWEDPEALPLMYQYEYSQPGIPKVELMCACEGLCVYVRHVY